MTGIERLIVSPTYRERVVCEGWLDGRLLFELSNEPSRHFLLEVFPTPTGEPWRIAVDDLIAALQSARDALDYPSARGPL